MLELFKFSSLFLGVWFTIINTARLRNDLNVPSCNVFIQALSIAGFVYLQFCV